MGNVHMEASQINYRGGGVKKSVEEAIKDAIELTPEQKTNINKIPTIEATVATKAAQSIIATEFDSEAGVYAIGDLVMYEGKLYEFTTAHETPGDWDSTEVSEKTVADEIDSLESGLTNLHNGYYRVNVTGECESKWFKIAEHTATLWNIDIAIIAIGGGTIKRLTLRYDQTEATFNNSLTKIESIYGSTGRLAYKYSENKVEVFWKAQRYGINTYTVLSESGNTPVAFQVPAITDYVDADMDYIEPST